MKYKAVWNDSSGEVFITEDGTVIHEDNAGDAPTAGAWVRENGFGFTDMWAKVPDSCKWTADLKAVETTILDAITDSAFAELKKRGEW